MTRHPTAGLSLVEVLVALAVFAVIGSAAFALLDQTLRSERLAGARLDRLVQEQRAWRILTIDTMQAVAGSVRLDETGLTFLRRGEVQTAGPTVDGLVVHYALQDGSLIRAIGAPGADPARQVLLPDVSAAAWLFVAGGTPQPEVPPGLQALDLTLTLDPDTTLRGLFPLPQSKPKAPP